MPRPEAPELNLVLACARAHTTPADEASIRALLAGGIDWTIFVQKAVSHSLAGLVGHTLTCLVPDAVPDDIRAAFAALIEETRKSNQRLLDELARLIALLAQDGVQAIPFKGPVLAQQAFGDLGLRGFRDLDFLIRDCDLDRTIRLLGARGYERQGKYTPAQYALIHRLQGQEVLLKRDVAAIEPHTRLISHKMALDIDYEGLWKRARQAAIFGHEMLTFSPEDTLLVLAIHGGKELWWDIKWVCDVADFIAAHPGLDWNAIATRAQAQGCRRMLLVAVSLADKLDAPIPDFIAAAAAGDRPVGEIVGRILARWEMDDPGGPPSNKVVSKDRLLLHDGLTRQARYVLRTLFLPGPQHVGLASLPRALGSLYIPLSLGHDLIALPLYRAWNRGRLQAQEIHSALILSSLPLAMLPVSSGTRLRWRRLRQAHRQFSEMIAAQPENFTAWVALADTLFDLKRYRQAIANYDKAVALVPDVSETWKKRERAVAAWQKATNPELPAGEPQFDASTADGWALRAGYLMSRDRYSDASEASRQALELDPGHVAAARIGILSRHYGCDWSQFQEDQATAIRGVESGSFALRPVNIKQMCDSEALSLSLARFLANGIRLGIGPIWQGERYNHEKIRIAYISSDLRSHPVGTTIVAPLECHDKQRFEVTALSIGPDDGSPIRQRIEKAADRFLDVQAMSDQAVAQLIRELEIDIAIDLNGLTGQFRSRILAHRPAPVQVNYLGYPGTMGASFIDYIIADKVVISEDNRAYYSEQIAKLPHAYLPYDGGRTFSEKPPSRSGQGLPERGFVFTCFNSLHKLVPDTFSAWMRILRAVDGSVLWVPSQSDTVIANLRREAMAQGVAPDRLVFAAFEKNPEDHLARLRLADLFLDTLPYNAHSTAAEALWAGLPLLTCRGKAFQARVGASLLEVLNLPELVTASLAEYETLAIALARNSGRLAAIRERLARGRDASPLFDVPRYTRGLEAAYMEMWKRQQSGLPPESFVIPAGT